MGVRRRPVVYVVGPHLTESGHRKPVRGQSDRTWPDWTRRVCWHRRVSSFGGVLLLSVFSESYQSRSEVLKTQTDGDVNLIEM